MRTRIHNLSLHGRHVTKVDAIRDEGYPIYPINEDIYYRSHKEKDLDPEDLSRMKELNENENI